MDPQFLCLLLSNVAILVGLEGGHYAGLKLTIKLGGRAPKMIQVKTPPSDVTSFRSRNNSPPPLRDLDQGKT